MKKLIWIPLFSFLIEMICSCFVPLNTQVFHTLFTLVAIIVIAPYFSNKETLYYKIAFLVGIGYDMIINNTLFFNAVLFLTIAFFTYRIYQILSNHLFLAILITALMICIYRLFQFLILIFMGYIKYDLSELFGSITSSLFVNIIYVAILFFIVRFFAKKYKIIKIY